MGGGFSSPLKWQFLGACYIVTLEGGQGDFVSYPKPVRVEVSVESRGFEDQG